jgi:hypothetical protein
VPCLRPERRWHRARPQRAAGPRLLAAAPSPWTGVQRHEAKISVHIAVPAKPKPQVSKPSPAQDSQRDRRQVATVALLSDRAPPRGFSTYPDGLASRSNGSRVMRASMGGMTS